MSDLLNWIEAHPGLAAWVQAIGTIAAIIVAALLPRLEDLTNQQRAARAARPRIVGAVAALSAVLGYADRTHHDTPERTRITEKLETHLAKLETIHFDRLPPHTVHRLQNVIELYKSAIARLSAGDGTPSDWGEAVRSILNCMATELTEARKGLRGLVPQVNIQLMRGR